ncbi:MAG: tetratricopeptide repeat protein [Gammaproteobacteria bacterium]|nr:tetratricopeptide repeat protein [Gammaproteobacteria bacterium]MDH3858183.1 tetratricopeptide repeat protein [Gammaproteobacteria bacterium]
MEDKLPRKLAAILYADVADYSRLTGEDEDTTHRRLSEYLDLASNSIGHHQGKVVHYAGDAVLADFSTVTNALECATSIQNDLSNRNQDLPDERKIQFRIGINLGEVIVDRDDIYGNDVNVAARLESLADVGGICISETVRTAIGNKLPIAYEFMGEQSVKNIKDPIRAYQVRLHPQEQPREVPPEFQEFELPQKPSIAVLPFTNMNADPEQEYFSDGITEDIITALSKINNLLVIARNSTFTYKGKAVDVRQISREQGVRYVLEGSVRKAGNRIRVTAQLIDALSGHHIWAERYDRELNDIFAVQDEIMREIVVALDVELNEGEQARIWSSGTTNVEAWECVRLGSYKAVYSANPEVKSQAKALLEKALELDPTYAIAWVMLGWIYQQYADVASLASDSSSPETSLASMLECAQKALDADPSCADAYGLLAMYHLELKEFDQAKEMAEKAISLAPNNAQNLGEVSMVLNKTGNPQRALELKKRAMRACPMYRPGFLRGLGLSYYLLGQLDSAISAFKQSIARESEYLSAHTNLASIYGELGRLEEAKEPVSEILRLAPDFSIKTYMKGLSFSDPKILTRMEDGLLKAGLPE